MVVSRGGLSPEATLERLRQAWAELDADSALACFAESGDLIVVGTDAHEYWHGFEAIIAPFRAMTDAFNNAEYAWEPDDPGIVIRGDIAWAAGRLTGRFVSDGQSITLAMRTTYVLAWAGDAWLIEQAHFSVPSTQPVAY